MGFQSSDPPVAYDFFPFGGVHRSVGLFAVPPTHLTDAAVSSRGVGGDAFEVHARVRVEAGGAAPDAVELEVDGLRERVPLAAVGEETQLRLTLPGSARWSPADPRLHDATVRLLAGETVLDEAVRRIGLRTVAVDGDRLLLNGEPLFLRGFGKHEDFPVIGKATCPALLVRDHGLMRWIGANSYRTSHYPYAEEALDFADEHGVLVIGEAALVGLEERFYGRPDRLAAAQDAVAQMIRRDLHHPSVISWSVANEPNVRSAAGADFFGALAATARAEDRDRPVMYVAHSGPDNNLGMHHFDWMGVNKYFGWYESLGTPEHSSAALSDYLDGFHAALGKPILLAEYGADAVAGLHSFGDEMFSEEFQAQTLAAHTAVAESKPFVVGTHAWNFADFRTAQSPKRVTMNRKGVFTRDRTPKAAAWALRRCWERPPAGR